MISQEADERRKSSSRLLLMYAVVASLILFPVALARGSVTKINTGACYAGCQVSDRPLTPYNARFYLYTLPVEITEKLQAICGAYHGVSDGRDGRVRDAFPLGSQVPRTRLTAAAYPKAMKECTFGRLYDTNHYAWGALWRQFLIGSPLRVADPKDADVVFVDLVDDACMTEDAKDVFNQTAPLSREALRGILEHLNKTGKPHIVPLSKYERGYYSPAHGGGIMAQSGAEKLTWLTFEITDVAWRGIQMPGRAPGGNMKNFSHYNVVPIPYPSTLHMYTHDRYFLQHIRNMRNRASNPDANTPRDKWPCYLARKDLLAAGSYSARYPVRRELKRQCLAAGAERCKHVESYHSYDFVNVMQDMHDAYGRAWFCIMPHGDTHSRRSFVDCLLQDAIPVMFRQFTFDTIALSDLIDPSEYVVNLPELEPTLDYMGKDEAGKKKYLEKHPDFVFNEDAKDILGLLERRYPLEKRMKMVTRIFELKHLFQTLLDPVHELVRFDQLNEVHCLDDSFTTSFKAALRSLCRRKQLPEDRCKGKVSYDLNISSSSVAIPSSVA